MLRCIVRSHFVFPCTFLSVIFTALPNTNKSDVHTLSSLLFALLQVCLLFVPKLTVWELWLTAFLDVFRMNGSPGTWPVGSKVTTPTTKPTAQRHCHQVGNFPTNHISQPLWPSYTAKWGHSERKPLKKHLFLFQMLFLLVKTTHCISVLDVVTVASAIGGWSPSFKALDDSILLFLFFKPHITRGGVDLTVKTVDAHSYTVVTCKLVDPKANCGLLSLFT